MNLRHGSEWCIFSQKEKGQREVWKGNFTHAPMTIFFLSQGMVGLFRIKPQNKKFQVTEGIQMI